jgi:tetratricopeptide (TPR) repeat protein
MLDWLELPGDQHPSDAELSEEVRRRSPAEDLMARGDEFYFDGDFACAAADFAKARQHDPMLFPAWAAESEAHVRSGDLDQADACATEALETYGKVPIFYAAKAIVLAHQGHIRLAYEHSDISVRDHEASVFTWLSRAEVVLAAALSREMRGVEACFEKALKRDPTRWQARFRSALILFDWGHADRARQRLAETAKVVPDKPFLWKLVGDCHRQLGRDILAREHYQLALAARPGYRPALRALRSMTRWGRLRARLARLFRSDH